MALPEKPITRKETYLARAAGQNVDLPPYPITREEAYLDEIARNGGGGGGTTDYTDLENKPKINSVELSGNKTLADLGLMGADDIEPNPADSASETLSKIRIGEDVFSVSSGGGGSTGDYLELDNKPQINGVTLVGNKTPVQLGFGTVDNLVMLNAMTVAEFKTWLAVELADVHDFTQIFQISFHAAVGDRISAGDVIRGSFISDGGFKFSGYLNGENTIAAVTFDYSVQDGVDNFTVGDAFALSSAIPTTLAELTDDATHRTVTDTEKTTWNGKSDFSGDYSDLTNKPTIPDELADLTADSTHRVVTDAQISTWNGKSDFSGNYNDLTNKPTIPTDASDISYDNTDSGLQATDVQGAVDEVAEEKADKSDIAPEFNTTTAYAKGDLCYHESALYEFNQAHSTGAWNASHVDNVSLNDMTKTNRDTSLSNITFYRVGNMAIMELNEKNVTLSGGSWVEIGTVPTGYIPKYKCYGVGKQFNGDKPITLEISTTGKIFCMGTGTSAVSVVGQLVYVI